MLPPSMESIFLILSGVVLAAGVLYWFWSHIQLTQKKVQLLENAVFELRGMLTSASSSSSQEQEQGQEQGQEQEKEEAPVYNDLADDEEEEDWVPSTQVGSTSLEELASDDLAPGGGAAKGLAPESPADNQTAEKFRELFIQHEQLPSPAKAEAPAATNASLDSMPVKELRRLAEQRGITGVSDLKKKELLSALRQQVTVPSASVSATVGAASKEVVVERTLDLTEVEELAEAPALE